MELTENTPLVAFEDFEGGEIYVVRLCPTCGRFIKKGRLFVNLLGNVRLDSWICKRCGEIKPYWFRS